MIVILGVALIFVMGVAGCDSRDKPDDASGYVSTAAGSEWEFPSLHITSDLHPFQAERAHWHPGHLTLTGATDELVFENESVWLRGRGNSTWVLGEDKRPLRIRFDVPRTLLSEYVHRDWVLVSNHFDMSLLRNYAAMYLGSLMEGMYHTPMVQNVHLYINGEYVGLYLLTDERDVGLGRSRLAAHDDPAISEYYFELDGHVVGWRAHERTIWEDYFIADGRAYSVRYPGNRVMTMAHMEYLHDFVTRAGEAFASYDFDRISALVDIDSLVDFYIVQELFKNIDVAEFSVFMQIRGQGENRRLHFGPVWDFDRSAGNTRYWYEHEYIFAGWYNIWFRNALETPELADIIINRWKEVASNQIEQMLDRLWYFAQHYSHEFNRNFEVHNIQESRPYWLYDMVPDVLRDVPAWDAQAEYLIDWLVKRVDWLNWYFAYFHEHDWE